MITSTVYHQSQHLGEEELLPEARECPFCSCTYRDIVSTIQDRPAVHLLSCRECNAASASRMPSTAALDSYYGSYYAANDQKVTIDNPDKLGDHIFKHAVAHGMPRRPRMRILDFGSGGGGNSLSLASRLQSALSEETEVTLVDSSCPPAVDAKPGISTRHYTNLSKAMDGDYDFVIASSIIEHIPDVRQILIDLFHCISPQGIFYARTPFVVPFVRLFAALKLSFDFTFPAHVHDLGPRFWNGVIGKLVDADEFQVIRSAPSLVETSFRNDFARTLAAHILKAGWYLNKQRYTLVGGWEVFIRRLQR
jgi:hypothetical protein